MIPTSKDVRQLIGDWAEHVDNRSLLFEKFSLPKMWGQEEKVDDAGRWSVLRIVTDGKKLLNGDAMRLQNEASGGDVKPHVRKRKTHLSEIARKMANFDPFDRALINVANQNASLLLEQIKRSFQDRVETFEATLGARMMVNMAGGVVENAGICLDRCFGLPYLPGSAIKGIARHQALWEIKTADGNRKRELLHLALLLFGFGNQDVVRQGVFAWAGGSEAEQIAKRITKVEKDSRKKAEAFRGCASFLPAYPTTPPTLVVDMVNPHYREYYQGKRKTASDDENPIPNYFPAVEAGCSFGFAVLLNRQPEGFTAQQLLQQARQWIERAITQKGAGAKTAAGYGWFRLGRIAAAQPAPASMPAPKPAEPDSPLQTFLKNWSGRLNTKDNFPVALPEMLQLPDADLKQAFEKTIPEQERRKLKKNNPYWQSFTSGKHAEAGKKILQRLGLTLS